MTGGQRPWFPVCQGETEAVRGFLPRISRQAVGTSGMPRMRGFRPQPLRPRSSSVQATFPPGETRTRGPPSPVPTPRCCFPGWAASQVRPEGARDERVRRPRGRTRGPPSSTRPEAQDSAAPPGTRSQTQKVTGKPVSAKSEPSSARAKQTAEAGRWETSQVGVPSGSWADLTPPATGRRGCSRRGRAPCNAKSSPGTSRLRSAPCAHEPGAGADPPGSRCRTG